MSECLCSRHKKSLGLEWFIRMTKESSQKPEDESSTKTDGVSERASANLDSNSEQAQKSTTAKRVPPEESVVSSESSGEPARWKPLLKRADQAFVGVVLCLALVSLVAYWQIQSRKAGGLIEIDRATRQTATFQVDLNQAEWPEFAQLPGIGETLARRIVESRASAGPFISLEDVQRVNGIGPKTMERLRPFLLPMAESGTVVESPLLLEYE